MKKKFLSLLLVLSMLCAFMPIIAAADTPRPTTAATITKSETDTTYNFDVAPAEQYANCYVYAAVYDANGALLNVNRVPFEMTGNTNISVDKSAYDSLVKVFIWSDDIQPIIKAQEFFLTQTPTPTATPVSTLTPAPNITCSLDEATGTLTISGTGDMENYSYNSLPPWIEESDKITSVVIENGVTSISAIAFNVCSSLTSITIPESVTSIDNSAFTWCQGLKNINVASGNQNYKSIDGVLFDKAATKLAAYPAGKQDEKYEIPDSVTNIGQGAFFLCSELTNITIPDSVTDIGNSAFSNCVKLESITIPNSVTNIENNAFSNCSSLTSVTIPDSVTDIGGFVFSNCSSLTSIIIPNSVTDIGENAFYNCSSLTSVTIPDSVTSIDNSAFALCSNLDSVYISDLAAYLSIEGKSPMQYANKLYLNNNKVEGEIILPDSIAKIVSDAFNGCDGITSVVIPDSVTDIGENAFYNCSGLTSINIPDSVTSIGNSAFSRCSGLESVTIPDSVTSIGNSAFSNCSGLINITLPDSITSIGNSTFSGSNNLISITLPGSVTSIGNHAFYYCGFISITIPNSVTSIGDYAFAECSGLRKVRYCGSEEEWQKISIGSNNNYLRNAEIIYDYAVK